MVNYLLVLYARFGAKMRTNKLFNYLYYTLGGLK